MTGQRHPAFIVIGVTLPVALIIGVIVAAYLAERVPAREPVALGPVPAPSAQGPECRSLLPALPRDLGDYRAADLAEPAPPATTAWQRDEGGDPIVLRCGLDRPLEFNAASALQVVNSVQWFEVTQPGVDSSTWFAVDRGVYIALTVPKGTGPTPLQAVSDTITATVPSKALDPGPLPN